MEHPRHHHRSPRHLRRPRHYITPNWYAGKHDNPKQVLTWNYAVVHAYGPLRVIQDPDWLLAHLNQLTEQSETQMQAQSEASSPTPWKVADAPAGFIRQLINGIVGFELPIRRLEGKWKVSQNRSTEDKQGVVAGLSDLNTPESLAMRDLIADARPREARVGRPTPNLPML